MKNTELLQIGRNKENTLEPLMEFPSEYANVKLYDVVDYLQIIADKLNEVINKLNDK
jgi:hypothetical protein